MAMKACRECKTEISSHAKTCPNCGIKKPHQHPFARGFNTFANGLMALGILLILLPLLGMCVFGAVGGEHRHVSGDALEARECYHALAVKPAGRYYVCSISLPRL